ncbi:MAG: nicotinate phosphoribosyltransferase [Spirochaetaceae bacterium]|nr:nicotinate phosphoribosyltransferase [Spirochaetaceae bacterium]
MDKNISALFTDFYELTMAQGFWKRGMDSPVVFDMFFRRHPFDSGFSVFCGSEDFFTLLENFRFSEDDLNFLRTTGIFEEGFLSYLRDWKFSGDIYAMAEGTIVFPNEPLLRIHGNLIEAQIIEGFLLNTVNFQSLIATKTARVYLASKKGRIMEFGLRRAQGYNGAMSATRAAFIGGAAGTSNTLGGKSLGIPVMGTIAHSWIMSFPSEREAFDAYAEIYPQNSIFLLDTYNTLGSGIQSAIEAGKKLMEKGYNFGVRLDSGDIQYLSCEVRRKLDEAGCFDAKISVSNDLDEEIIASLIEHGAPIDSWGVGTHMVTGGNDAAFTGVYKLAWRHPTDGDEINVMKISDNPAKTTNPGIKQVYRLFNEDGTAKADVIAVVDEEIPTNEEGTFFHPDGGYRQFSFSPAKVVPLLEKRIEKGKRCVDANLSDHERMIKSRKNMEEQLDLFHQSFKRLLNPHVYKVSLTEKLSELKKSLILPHL